MEHSINAALRGERLSLAVVLGTTEDACDTVVGAERAVVPYAPFFPAPRVDRVAPGHLVAVVAVEPATVVWRWFDAVVVDEVGDAIRLWEPAHGFVLATPRDPRRTYRAGTRAYLSAGLPGADWWVAGAVVEHAADADVDRAEVEDFLTELGLLAGPP